MRINNVRVEIYLFKFGRGVTPSCRITHVSIAYTRVRRSRQSLPSFPPFFYCPTRCLRCGQRQPTRGFSPGTAIIPALSPPLPSKCRAVSNAAAERAYLLRSAKSARRERAREPAYWPEGGHAHADRLPPGTCVAAPAETRSPKNRSVVSVLVRVRVYARVQAVGPRHLLTPCRRR